MEDAKLPFPQFFDKLPFAADRSGGLLVVVQPALLDPRPSRRTDWRGASATAFLNQVDRRAGRGKDRGTVFSLGIMEENIVPGAA